jgi:erythronate-4-phosphate dehydrogenase
VIINASRGGIVNEDELLNTKKNLVYCTDVYLNEPDINKNIINYATLCTPHIAGHSIEAKHNAVLQISQKLRCEFNFDTIDKPQSVMPSSQIAPNEDWQSYVLSLYNPKYETIKMKNAPDKKMAFKSLRKLHNFRHDFSAF